MAAPNVYWVYLFTGAIIIKCHRLGSLLSCSSRGWIHTPDPSLILKQIIVPDARSAAKTQPSAVRFFQKSLAGKVSFPRIIFSSQSSSCPKNDQNDALKAQPPPSTWLTLKTHPCIKQHVGATGFCCNRITYQTLTLPSPASFPATGLISRVLPNTCPTH